LARSFDPVLTDTETNQTDTETNQTDTETNQTDTEKGGTDTETDSISAKTKKRIRINLFRRDFETDQYGVIDPKNGANQTPNQTNQTPKLFFPVGSLPGVIGLLWRYPDCDEQPASSPKAAIPRRKWSS
jgi:hypothetical protein